METKYKFLILFLAVFTAIAIHVTTPKMVAAGGSINITPNTSTYKKGDIFQVAVNINGGGIAFNAAKSTVNISPSLTVQSLTIGDCGFAFVRTPTSTNQSFAGVILGGSRTGCTVYTLALKAAAEGVGTIALSNASLKSQKGAADILSSLGNASYIIIQSPNVGSSSQPTPIQAPIIGPKGEMLYSIIYNVSTSKALALSDANAFLDSNIQGARIASDSFQFDKVPQGVHVLTLSQKGVVLSKEIINVAGSNGTMIIGVSIKEPEPSHLWLWIFTIIGLIIISIFAVIFYKKLRD
ncbi:MAG: hypothetical protein A3B47_00025 [Candidatus Levybacteria bacterium RIFCSPLOWO2_01_FULL_39_24]|nr:MAG: hypothetical protein A2800_01165 [Candidatus Levybacteria bacterium RIFCSPHIGHO2_01_FULL_40_16]OGH28714.1 MAG: hypothetical protein A3E12_03400 [Candidatus Levybacteria bacterium RIFCSPHIGHO2_12_FULL_39_9]OGH46163.1 MAG: hypothetical protein A3B47_00025 [Candidatus Levybacteria bacterium RIFCSPLOWO2_01_FULL_39_24]